MSTSAILALVALVAAFTGKGYGLIGRIFEIEEIRTIVEDPTPGVTDAEKIVRLKREFTRIKRRWGLAPPEFLWLVCLVVGLVLATYNMWGTN